MADFQSPKPPSHTFRVFNPDPTSEIRVGHASRFQIVPHSPRSPHDQTLAEPTTLNLPTRSMRTSIGRRCVPPFDSPLSPFICNNQFGTPLFLTPKGSSPDFAYEQEDMTCPRSPQKSPQYKRTRVVRPIAISFGENCHAELSTDSLETRVGCFPPIQKDEASLGNPFLPPGSAAELHHGDSISSTYADFCEIKMSAALTFIHQYGIAHLDVKPDNIYIKCNRYILGDFGCATLLDGSMEIAEGDSRYMPREILNERYEQLDKVDIFSLGVATYELIIGPSLSESDPYLSCFKEGSPPRLTTYPQQLTLLLQAMVDEDPMKRPSAKEILKNPIFDKQPDGGWSPSI